MTWALGLTGSIGMGKSTTLEMFREEGVPVWDADEAVHRLYDVGGAAVGPLSTVYPQAIEAEAVSRAALKRIIASDEGALAKIEGIVHPLVAEDRAAFLAARRAEGAEVVVFDIPLLYEIGAESWLDSVLVVTAPRDVQKQRVLARPEMTEAHFHAILARQMPDAEKRRRADHIIETVTLDAARLAVRDLLSELREKARA